MNSLAVIALGLALNTFFLSTSHAGSPRKHHSGLCEDLLASFQDKLSRELNKKLRAASSDDIFTVFLLISLDGAQPLSAEMLIHFQELGIDLIRSTPSIEGKTYLEVRGTKKSILKLLKDFEARENTLGTRRLEWVGLRRRPTKTASDIDHNRPTDSGHPVEGIQATPDFDAVMAAKDRLLMSEVFDFPGFRSVGIGKNSAGAYILSVGVATAEDLAGKPGIFEGIEVQYQVVGEIVALGNRQPSLPTDDSSQKSTDQTLHEVLSALSDPDRSKLMTVIFGFQSKMDLDAFRNIMEAAGNGIVDSFILDDDEAPYFATVKGTPDTLKHLVSHLVESMPDKVTFELPARRRLITPVRPRG